MNARASRTAARALLAIVLVAATRSHAQPAGAAAPEPPSVEEGFDFVVLGELVETGEPARPDLPDRPAPPVSEGVARVLEAAAWLEPDFVMTTGNLISAPRSPERWEQRARALLGVMGELGAAWYPVIGAGDLLGEGAQGEGERAALYASLIGPRRYAFEHRFALVVALDTHDGGPGQVSPAQISWLGETLAASDARRVLVFAHADLWNSDAEAWRPVHGVLAADGRPVTVFGSAARAYRDDGTRDGVSYHTLGPAEGRAPGESTGAYSWPHLTLVRVRPGGVHPVILPAAPAPNRPGVRPPTWQSGEEVDLLRTLAEGGWAGITGMVAGPFGGPLDGTVLVRVENPTGKPMPYSVSCTSGIGAKFSPGRVDGTLGAGESLTWDLSVSGGTLGTSRPDDHVRVSVRYPMDNGEVASFVQRVALPVHPTLPGDATTDAGTRGSLSLNGRSALEVDLALPDTFTIEAWVRAEAPRERAAIVSTLDPDAGADGAGLFWMITAEGDPYPAGIVRASGRNAVVQARGAWSWDAWGHLALAYDGSRVRLFVNGELADEQPLTGAVGATTPLMVGASPEGARIGHWFRGLVDEVRVSAGARYAGAFRPPAAPAADDATLVLYGFNATETPLGADASGGGTHAWVVGSPARADRDEP